MTRQARRISRRLPDKPPRRFREDFQTHLVEGPPVTLNLEGHHAWVLMMVIQKATAASFFPQSVGAVVERIARQIEPLLARTPVLAAAAAATWDDAPLPEEERFVADFTQHVVLGPRVVLELRADDAWMLFAGLQTVVRLAPPMPPLIMAQVEVVARGLQRMVGRTPYLAEIAAAGWDPAQDR
jgi:hypothetical protein